MGRHRMTMIMEPKGPVIVRLPYFAEREMNPREEWRLAWCHRAEWGLNGVSWGSGSKAYYGACSGATSWTHPTWSPPPHFQPQCDE